MGAAFLLLVAAAYGGYRMLGHSGEAANTVHRGASLEDHR